MHVRGSSLSQPRVVETLRPFIVAFWGQANDEPIPSDVRPLYEASGFGYSNVRCFVLDSAGKLLHSFDGFPAGGGPFSHTPDEYAAYYAAELSRASVGLNLPKVNPVLKLPPVKDGVRLYIRLPDRNDSYGYPMVEPVENQDEWKTLAYPAASRKIDAAKLSRWLRLCYPAGVNEQLEPYQSIQGTLGFRPAGKDRAILSGEVRLALTEGGYEIFEGKLEAVSTYAPVRTLRGVVDGTYWRFDQRNNRWMPWRLTMAIESVPK